jgi:hypothetical protein
MRKIHLLDEKLLVYFLTKKVYYEDVPRGTGNTPKKFG